MGPFFRRESMRTPTAAAWLLLLSAFLVSCENPGKPSRRPALPGLLELAPLEPPRPDWDSLAAGGDTVLARREHDYVARRGVDWPLREVAPLLAGADGALCNLECCVALGGFPAVKGEANPCYFRARPEMLRVITRAGIDMVTAANNHGADYGPLSAAETLRWTREAGLVCAGLGLDLAQAGKPVLVRVGRTRVALAAMDTTMPSFIAGRNRPGVNHVPEGDLEIFEDRVRRLGEWARGRCDLLILTIHWGRNWDRETSAVHRKMARIAFHSGVDLILGHSAHRLQGVEIVDGKMVVYDMGNLLLDGIYKEPGKMGGVFLFRISPKGVHRLEIHPTQVLAAHTVRPKPAEAWRTLREMADLCRALGTELELRRSPRWGPVGVIRAPIPRATPRPPVGKGVVFRRFPATREFSPTRNEAALVEGLPGGAVELDPPWKAAPGVELLGYRLPSRADEGTILYVHTWWRVTKRVKAPWLVSLEILDLEGRIFRTAWYNRHDPADWTLPLRQMKPGEIVEDFYPARLGRAVPPGTYQIRALVLDPRKGPGGRLGPALQLGTFRVESLEWKGPSGPEKEAAERARGGSAKGYGGAEG